MKLKCLVVFVLIILIDNAQQIPPSRIYEWGKAGNNQHIEYLDSVNVLDYGALGDGQTENSQAFQQSLSALSVNGGMLYVPNGNYYFSDPLELSDNILLKGNGSENTTLVFDLDANETDLINVKGAIENTDYGVRYSSFLQDSIIVLNQGLGSVFTDSDYIQIYKNDSSLIISSWALKTVGQILKIKVVLGDTIYLESKLRTDYPITKEPFIRRINPRENVGIECLKINRLDTQQVHCANIKFEYAVNSYVKGVESQNCNFSHVSLIRSTNVSIKDSYFHHAFSYGGGGAGYGVVAMYTTGECLIENNIFEHLRHSMLLQAGANGNVFSYNYSIDPFWTEVSLPSNSAGDMVLHGNYPYANLFEGNICQNIVVDDSHGANGPHNTFLRNRANTFGLFMNSGTVTDSCSFIGNEITSNTFFQGLYSLSGIGHFEYGNNVKGNIIPSNTLGTFNFSYYLDSIPSFLNATQYPFCGAPAIFNSDFNSAYERNELGITAACGNEEYASFNNYLENKTSVFPNPSNSNINFVKPTFVQLYNQLGEAIFFSKEPIVKLNVSKYPRGLYLLKTEEGVVKIILE